MYNVIDNISQIGPLLTDLQNTNLIALDVETSGLDPTYRHLNLIYK